MNCALWALVGLRLLLPFSFESVFSLIPSAQTVGPDIIYSQTQSITSGIPAINSAVNPIIFSFFAPEVGASANPLQIWTAVASYVWLIGLAAMLIYAAASFLRLRKRVGASLEDEHIIELYFKRDELAITETDCKYGAFCHRVAMNILSIREDAEECVNDTYHAAWQKMPPEFPNSLRAFLGRITRNLSISRFRKNRAAKRYQALKSCSPSLTTAFHPPTMWRT